MITPKACSCIEGCVILAQELGVLSRISTHELGVLSWHTNFEHYSVTWTCGVFSTPNTNRVWWHVGSFFFKLWENICFWIIIISSPLSFSTLISFLSEEHFSIFLKTYFFQIFCTFFSDGSSKLFLYTMGVKECLLCCKLQSYLIIHCWIMSTMHAVYNTWVFQLYFLKIIC